jgi:hypothetical protein
MIEISQKKAAGIMTALWNSLNATGGRAAYVALSQTEYNYALAGWPA